MLRRAMVLSLAALALAGCETVPKSGTRPDLLDFLKDGVTTKDEAFIRLGQPSGTFEGGRIVTWRLLKNEDGYAPSDRLLGPEQGIYPVRTTYSLVLVFGPDNVLSRHSLVLLGLVQR